MKTVILQKYGNEYPMSFDIRSYANNGNLYVGLISHKEGYPEPWSALTINLDQKCKPNHAFIDCNNNGAQIIPWLEENGFGHVTHNVKYSGFCVYPEFAFNMERLLEFTDEGR